MIRTLLNIFLFINSIIGYQFYEGTVFGDYVYNLSETGQLIFVLVNFIASHLLIILLNFPLAFMSTFLLVGLMGLALLLFGIWLPYYIIYQLFDANGESVFAGVVFFIAIIGLIPILIAPVLNFLIKFLRELSDSFFDGLSKNAIDNAIKKSNGKK
jgi:hypothetical protein